MAYAVTVKIDHSLFIQSFDVTYVWKMIGYVHKNTTTQIKQVLEEREETNALSVDSLVTQKGSVNWDNPNWDIPVLFL